MRIKKVLPINNFPHRFFSVVAIFTLVAFLLTLKPISMVIKTVAENVGINFPPVEIFQNTAANMLLIGLGALALLVAGVIAIPIIKIAVTVTAIAVVGVGLYNIYRTFTGKGTKDILPDNVTMNKK
jgi:hypothetical protein